MSLPSFFTLLFLLFEGAAAVAAVTKAQRKPHGEHHVGCGSSGCSAEAPPATGSSATAALSQIRRQPSGGEESSHNMNHLSQADRDRYVRAATEGHSSKEKESEVGDNDTDIKTVNIQLYYETRCPDCIQFLNQTLEPLWRNQELRKHLNLTVNPYGNSMSLKVAEVSEGYKFWHPATTGLGWDFVHVCQHGSDECLGNLIQACTMNIAETHKHMDLVFCMAAHPDWSVEKSSHECLNSNGVDIDKVAGCVRSPEGNKLMMDLGKQTQAVQGRLGTPWVVVDGNTLSNVTALMQTVCMTIDNKPSSCSPFKDMPKPKAPEDDSNSAPSPDDFQVLSKLDTVKNFMKAIPKQI